MKIGLFQTAQWPEGSEQNDRYAQLIEQCVLAEALGFESVWMTEHHFTRHGITSDSLALLSHLAARTSRIRLGTAVLVLPFHDPVRLAESTALVDHLSHGRLDVGVGRGYQWAEYHGFGVRFDEGSDRFEEALELLLTAWTTEAPFEFDGKYHSYSAANPQPKSVQRPHPPLWHATGSDQGLRRCAENDWGVMLAQATSLAAVAETVRRHREHVEAAGNAYRPERVVLARAMFCAPTTHDARSTLLEPYARFLDNAARVSAPPDDDRTAQPRNPFELVDGTELLDTAICGDPDRCVADLLKLQEVGVENVILFVNVAGLQHHIVVESLRLFASDVLPRVA